ncbi:MAG: CoA transferase [Chloroflexi bacterium]|nr:CoA transferase [Chloroflexota bacterium]
MGRALDGLLVVDLTRVLAGPFCTMVLADLGAHVIKVEAPSGDDARSYGPFVDGESTYFASLNRNKESTVLNLKSDAGRGIFVRLVERADIVVENFRPGTMASLGLDYARLRDVNPRLIYAACSGFGQTGPYRHKPAYDVIAQAMGGIMSLTGQPGGEPTRVGISVGDMAAGLFTAVGILAALEARHRTGVGQMVDVGMLDCQVAILENAIARFYATGEVPGAIGNRHPSITPFTSVRARDAHLVIAAGNDVLWRKLCQAIGCPELATDARFLTNDSRTRHAGALEGILADVFHTKDRAEWLDILEQAGVPCGPINTVADVTSDPQVEARQMIVDIGHSVARQLKVAGSPIKLSEDSDQDYRPPPLLGQDTRSVLQQVLRLEDDEIETLASLGAVGLAQRGD